METLKFLMVSSHFPPHNLGGDAVLVEYLSKELIHRGHEVDILYTPAAYELMRKKKHEQTSMGKGDPVVHQYYTWLKRFGPLFSLSLGLSGGATGELLRLVHQIKPDIVHWHNTKGFICRPIAVPRALSLYTAHDYYSICPRSNLLRPSGKPCESPLLCQSCLLRWGKPPQIWRINGKRAIKPPADFTVLSPSDFMANRLRREGIGVNRVIRNFVPDMALPRSHEDTETAERDSIIYLGMLEPHKGPQTLLEAFAECWDRQGFRLLVIGEGSLKTRLKRRAEELRILDRVRIPGFLSREQIRHEFRHAVTQVVPSEWYENSPLTALEALSFSIPLIGSDIGGLPEILDQKMGSLMFRAGNVHDLSDKIVSIWEDRHNLAKRRKMARQQYEERFRPEIHVSEYLATIDSAQN